MIKRKKRCLDGIDREIVRLLYLYQPLVSRKIAKCVGLSASGISPRLNNLMEMGIVKTVKTCGIRRYKRRFNNVTRKIESPQSIYWEIDIVKVKKVRGK